jgi:hypothetical protein
VPRIRKDSSLLSIVRLTAHRIVALFVRGQSPKAMVTQSVRALFFDFGIRLYLADRCSGMIDVSVTQQHYMDLVSYISSWKVFLAHLPFSDLASKCTIGSQFVRVLTNPSPVKLTHAISLPNSRTLKLSTKHLKCRHNVVSTNCFCLVNL